MAFWKKKKYCQYCGSEVKDGSCSNPDCIAFKKSEEKPEDNTKKEE